MWVDVWMPAEDEYVANQHPERIADLAVDSSALSEGERAFRAVAQG